MKFPPDSAEERLKAIRKARSWWSGEDLQKHSGVHFWETADPEPFKQWSQSSIRKKHRIHVPVAADVALVSADHLFGGGVELPSDPQVLQVADQVSLATLLPVGAERAAGMGEIYMRVGWRDRTVPLLDLVDPDRVVPEFSWGRMVAADVGTDLPDYRGAKWVHIERHEPGYIYHRLYERRSNPTSPLTPAPSLRAHPETANLQPVVRLPRGMANRLALIYVPNARPKNNRAGGASDTEGVESLMGQVDEIASSLGRDFRLGKARAIISEWMLERTKALDGTTFDTDADYFSPVGGDSTDRTTKDGIVLYQPEIRVTNHLDAIRDLIMRIVSSAGYSPDSLIVNRVQLPESGTARRLREAASIRTTQRKIAIWRPAVNEALSSLMCVAFGYATPPPVAVSIRSAYAPDIGEMAQVVAQLEAAKAASTEQKVRLIHPTWKDEDVMSEVAKIEAQQAAAGPPASDTPDDVIP